MATSLRETLCSVSSHQQRKVYYTYRQGLENWRLNLFRKLGITDAVELHRETVLKSDDTVFGFQWGKSRELIDLKDFRNELDGMNPNIKVVGQILLISFMEDNRQDHAEARCFSKEESRDENISFHEIHCTGNNEIIECARYYTFKEYVKERGILLLKNTIPDGDVVLKAARQFEEHLRQIISANNVRNEPLDSKLCSHGGDKSGSDARLVDTNSSEVKAESFSPWRYRTFLGTPIKWCNNLVHIFSPPGDLDPTAMLKETQQFIKYLEIWNTEAQKHVEAQWRKQHEAGTAQCIQHERDERERANSFIA